jgi:hypothetical protein
MFLMFSVQLLGRVFNILRDNNPELAGDRRRTVMRPPQVLREGTKKTVFVNFMDLCKTYVDLLFTSCIFFYVASQLPFVFHLLLLFMSCSPVFQDAPAARSCHGFLAC